MKKLTKLKMTKLSNKNKLNNKQKQTVNVKININKKATRISRKPQARAQASVQARAPQGGSNVYFQMPQFQQPSQENGLLDNLRNILSSVSKSNPLSIPSNPLSIPLSGEPLKATIDPPLQESTLQESTPLSIAVEAPYSPSVSSKSSISDYSYRENPLLVPATPTRNSLMSQIPHQTGDIFSREDKRVKAYKDKTEYLIGGSLPDMETPVVLAGRHMTRRKAHEGESGYVENYLTGRWVKEGGTRGRYIKQTYG